MNGKNAGKEMTLSKPSLKLGKPGLQVQITRRPEGHFIVILERADESSPVTVNGEDIGAKNVKLQNHDILEINQLKLEYYLAE